MPVLRVHYDLVQSFAALSLAQALTDLATVKHAGDLPQQFQVCVGSSFWHQQNEKQVDRRAIDGVEIYGSVKM